MNEKEKFENILTKENDNKFKIVIVGDSNVGKTSIFWQYIEGYFPDDISDLKVTMVDFKIKNYIIDGDLIKLHIWDTAGQERYRSLISNYFKGTHGILFVFDLCNSKSFDSIKNQWYQLCKDKQDDAITILVGNKADLTTQRQVSQETIDQYCQSKNLQYFEVSAFNGQNINQTFDCIAKQIKDKWFKKSKQSPTPQDQNQNKYRQSIQIKNSKSFQEREKKKKQQCCQ